LGNELVTKHLVTYHLSIGQLVVTDVQSPCWQNSRPYSCVLCKHPRSSLLLTMP